MLLGRAKDEHFSCFLSSFQLGLKWSWVKKSHVEGKWSCEFDKQFFFQLDISHVIYLQLKNFGSYVDHLDLQLFPVKIGKEQKLYFVTKIVLSYCEKNCCSDGENILKFEAEGREFPKILKSLDQFVRTVKGHNNFW